MNSLVVLPLFFAAAMAGFAPLATPYAAYAPYATPYAYAAVAPVAVGQAALARTQYHSQDAYSRSYNYGYAEPNSAKVETRHPDGTVTGSYSHALPDGRVLTNNYVADEDGFRSSLAPTAAKDFAPRVKAAYNIQAPVLAHTVQNVVVPQPALAVTRSVNYAAPAVVQSYGAPLVRSAALGYGYGAAPLAYGYGAPLVY